MHVLFVWEVIIFNCISSVSKFYYLSVVYCF